MLDEHRDSHSERTGKKLIFDHVALEFPTALVAHMLVYSHVLRFDWCAFGNRGREQKGAARELRKDNYFLAEEKAKEVAVYEEGRAQKTNEVMAMLQVCPLHLTFAPVHQRVTGRHSAALSGAVGCRKVALLTHSSVAARRECVAGMRAAREGV
jgi:hypothetical protein